MGEKITPPELGKPTVSYNIWSVVSRSSELVELTLPEVTQLEDTDLQDALWMQHSTATHGDGSQAVLVYTSAEHGTKSYLVQTKPSSL